MKQEEDRNYGCLDLFDFCGDDYSASNQVTQAFPSVLQGSVQAHQADVFRQAFKNKICLFTELLGFLQILALESDAEDSK